MALVAQGIDLRHVQQSGVLRAMRSVAPQTSFRLHRCVLEDKWSSRLRVALGADRILVCRGLQIVVPECTVNVMAVAACDQAFVDPVVERHIECRFHVGVALKTERELISL